MRATEPRDCDHRRSRNRQDYPATPSRSLVAASVDDVDAMYADLMAKGVRVLRPPTDQPWGLRTAYFCDPEGNFWEIHQPVASASQA